MANGSIQIYTSAGQAAPLAGVALTVLDENGAVLAHLTADADGFAEAADLPAPDAAYSLDEANSAVRPYAIYSVEAVLDGWQTVVLNGVQVFDGQQTVARLSLLPNGGVPSAARAAGGETDPDVVTIPPHTLFAGDGGSGPAPEELLPGNVLTRVVVPKKITVHLGKPSANVRNVTVNFQSYIANVASSEVYPTWDSVPSTQCGITRPLKAPDYFYRAPVVFWRTDDNRLYQGVHQGIGQRLGCIGLQFGLHQLFYVVHGQIWLPRTGRPALGRCAAAVVTARAAAGQFHLSAAHTAPDKPRQWVLCFSVCGTVAGRQLLLHGRKAPSADDALVGARYDDPLVAGQPDSLF